MMHSHGLRASSAAATPGIVTTGLVLNLDAGNAASYPGTGTTWTDLSGNGNTGTLVGSPTYSSANGGSIVFNGTSAYVTVNDSASIRFGTGDYTAEVFVYANDISAVGNGRIVISKAYTGLEFVFYGNTMYITPPVTTAGTGWAANTWYHIVSSRLNGVQTSYRNAVSIRTATVTTDISTLGTPFIIGARPPVPPVGHFQGSIPIVRLYNRALSAAEVSQNFNALRGRYGV
ncbi:MAG: LamG domain-containing protein [Bacteroidetes bacterium]|nr:LamG domain-containing protein [Bacteroidota bacterium]